MTAALLTRPVLAAGEALFGAAGRAGFWVLDQLLNLGSVIASRYARAPLASTAIVAMTVLSALAASNALYFQTMPHPAPLFADPVIGTMGVPDPELSGEPDADMADRSSPLVIMHDPAGIETGSASESQVPSIGNADVAAMQQKLAELRFFNGTVDGYYGPKTADAIRAFELANGIEPQGALTPEIMATILGAPVTDPVVMREPVAPEPEPVVLQAAALVEPTPELLPELEPLPALVPEVDTGAIAPEPLAATTADVAIEAAVMTTPMPPALDAAPTEATPEAVAAFVAPDPGAAVATDVATSDAATIEKIQRGLASLGFLHGTIDGVAGEATAKAIRNFEVFYSYKVTGRITPDFVDLLISKGAVI